MATPQTLDDEQEDEQFKTWQTPQPRYLNSNGFAADLSSTFGPESVAPSQLANATKAHRTALHWLDWKARDIPDFEEMEKQLVEETPEMVEAEIEELKRNHIIELERLYDAHALDLLQESIDVYRSRDETQYLDTSELTSRKDASDVAVLEQSYKRLDQLYAQAQGTHPLLLPMSEEYSLLRHSYLQKLHNLRTKASSLKKKLASQFPSSVEQYWDKSPDLQNKVAMFLSSDPATKEKMKDQYSWASRQVEPLEKEYKSNDEFRAEIIRQRVLLKVKLQTTVPGDPRKRP